MKRLRIVLALLFLALQPTRVAAQQVYFYYPADTVLANLPGRTQVVPLYLYTAGYGLSSYSVTLLFDDTKVHVGAVKAVSGYGFPDPTVTVLGPGRVKLEAVGSYSCCTVPVNVEWTLDAGAVEGTLVDFELNTLTGFSAQDLLPATRTRLFEVCRADKI